MDRFVSRNFVALPKKIRKVLMLMKAAKLGWAGAGAEKKQGWTKTRARKGRSRQEVGTGQE